MRPIRLFLVRHAVSEANLDKKVNARLPDNRVPLGKGGVEQAAAAGEALARYLANTDPLGRTRILCSPYTRTRQTCAEVENKLVTHGIKFDKREDIALREISFGLFDGLSDDELKEKYPNQQAYYEKFLQFEDEFYAPMPMGESRIQVADRVKSVFGTILRDADKNREDRVHNFVIVSHGVTIRAFIMQWLHKTPEWFAEQSNPWNASISMIESDGSSPYRLSKLFEGFPYDRDNKQEKREEGKL